MTRYLQLSASLQQVSFELDIGRLGCWYKISRDHGDVRGLKEMKAGANLVEVLSKRIVRCAPGAVLEMHEIAKQGLLPEYLELFNAAVNAVER